MVEHTPPEELLFDYAAGALPEPLAVLVASHLTLSPESRREVNEAEAVGGALLDELEPAALSDDALEAMMARLDRAGAMAGIDGDIRVGPTPAPTSGQGKNGSRVPGVLKDYVDARDFNSLPWRERNGSVAECRLLSDYPGFKTRLLRIRAGARVPSHTHGGREFTLVLQGGFSDEIGHYLPGDVSVADPNVTHQPVADDDEDCICLAVTDAPLKMTGAVGRVLNFFVDM